MDGQQSLNGQTGPLPYEQFRNTPYGQPEFLEGQFNINQQNSKLSLPLRLLLLLLRTASATATTVAGYHVNHHEPTNHPRAF